MGRFYRQAPNEYTVTTMWLTPVMFAALATGIAEANRGTPPPDRITGTFISGLTGPADPAWWTRELTDMRGLGIDTLIVQQATFGDPAEAVYAPCSAGVPSPRGDVLGALLGAADRLGGFTVYLGLGYRPDWKFDGSASATEYDALAAFNLRIADDLIGIAARHPCVRGWYLPQEPDGQRTWLPAQAAGDTPMARLVDHYYRPVIARLKAAGPDRPVAVAPFFGWNAMDPATFGAWWAELLRACPLDLVILQDGIGVHHGWLDPPPGRPGDPPCDALAYLGAMREACRQTSRSFWLDLETFRQDGDAFGPAAFLSRTENGRTIPGLRDQVEREGPAIAADGPAGNRIVCYEYLGTLSPRAGPDAKRLHHAYAAWLARPRRP